MRRGRLCVTVLNWFYLILIVVLYGFVLSPQNFGLGHWGPFATVLGLSYPVLFFVLFLLLTVTVTILIKRLKAKNKVLGATDEAAGQFFRKEIHTLTIILILFSISYLLRVVFDIGAVLPTNLKSFEYYMVALISTIPFDLIPVSVILIVHRKNFNQSS